MEPRGRVLVIDDEPEMCATCLQVLQGDGYHVDTAINGEQGLLRLRASSYDMVLLDLATLGIEWPEVLAKMQEIDPNLVCVAITESDSTEPAIQAVEGGAYGFVAKPLEADVLRLTVRQGVERHSLALQIERLSALEAEAQELTRQKSRLERLDRIKSAFTLTVAHELRAPVAAIQSYLRLILDGYISLPDQVQYLERAELRAQAQLELVDDFLDLARLEDVDVRAEIEPVYVDQVLREVLDAMTAHARVRDVQIESTITPHLPPINMNARHAKQLWNNLVSNAIKYSYRGGHVRVSLTRQGGHLVGIVADAGIGISEDEIPLVFQEFYRSRAGKKHCQMGTGLGLPIVKRILETYGGTIDVVSEPGKGSTFTFYLSPTS